MAPQGLVLRLRELARSRGLGDVMDAPVCQWELTSLRAFAHCSDQSVVLPLNLLGKILR